MKKMTSVALVAAVAGLAFAEPSPEEEFAKAYADGKPLTAETAFRRLVEKNPNAKPLYYYQAGQVSRQLLAPNGTRDRFAHLVRSDAPWDDAMAEACVHQFVTEGSARAFAKLYKANPKDPRLYGIGTSRLWNLRERRRGSDLLDLADEMLGAYGADKGRVNAILQPIWYLRCDDAAGFPWAKLRELMKKRPCIGEQDWFVVQIFGNREVFSLRDLIDYLVDVAKHPFDNNNWSYQVYNGGLYDGKRCKEQKECTALFRKLAKLEPVLFDPARGYTQQAITYSEHRFAQWWRYLDGNTPEATNAFRKASVALFEKLCKMPDVENSRERIRGLSYRLTDGKLSDITQLNRLRTTYPEYLNCDVLMRYGGWADQDEANKRYEKVPAALAKTGGLGYRMAAIYTTAKYGSPKDVYRTIEEDALRRPYNFDRDRAVNAINMIPKEKSSAAERSQFLQTLLRRIGYCYLWDAFASDGWKKAFWWVGDKACDPLRDLIKAKKPAEDKLIQLENEIYQLAKAKTCNDRAHAIIGDMLKAYGRKPWPAAKDDTDPIATLHAQNIATHYRNLCVYHGGDAGAEGYIKTATPLMAKGLGWWGLDNCYGRPNIRKDAERLGAYNLMRCRISGDYASFAGAKLPKGTKELPAWIDWTKPKSDQFFYFIDGNRTRVTDEVCADLVAKWMLSAKGSDLNEDWVSQLMYTVLRPVVTKKGNEAIGKALPWDALAKNFLDKPECHRSARAVIALGTCFGQGPALVKRYMAGLASLTVTARVTYLGELARMDEMWNTMSVTDAAKGTEDVFGPLVFDTWLASLKATKDVEAGYAGIVEGWSVPDWISRYVTREDKRNDQKLQTACGELYENVVRLLLHGAQRGGGQEWCRAFKHVFDKALAAKDEATMGRVAANLGRRWYGWIGWGDEFQKFGDRLAEAQYWEPLFLMANAVETQGDGWATVGARLRAKAAPHLPGVYPVAENHPAYPLYVAADELSRNNPERAWDLLQKSIPVFEREALKLPPDFTAWAVERLRMARGDKDALLLKARAIATQLIANEGALTPELAASLLLTRAESYRDQQNFEMAKLEYQAVRNNPKYTATKAGRKAMFRSVALMIDMGSASSAESIIEYWLSQPDAEVQAEAHYFLARIAFERKDYDETIKQLRETFAIDFTHTEARFLHGQWKLATNSEVDDTDVMIGTLKDRTVIRPGQQLTITVQDRNLSVAGGGASIPVIVTTKPGGDEERIFLYPSARDPNLFKGVVDVRLGKAAVSNLFLEVTGLDTASYVIDPAFLKARGLPINKPKNLRVVDDAKLEIENDDLRPGNPLYVTLEDKDRSLGGKGDAVNVAVTTSSGDKLKAFPLKEVAPLTGRFRGEIPTSLPPPRAFASDSAAGFNPGDAINSTREKPWQSLADGAPGKWLEVDTMASHLVREAKIDLENPTDIQSIALVGRLGADTIRLGSLPAESVEKRLGLRVRWDWHRGQLRREDQMRNHFRAARDNEFRMKLVTNEVAYGAVARKNEHVPQNVWWSGFFVTPTNMNYVSFKIVPKHPSGAALNHLWTAITIDGENVFQGLGGSLQNRLASFDLAPGVHQFELFASGCYNADDFNLLLDVGGEEKPFPFDWFSAAKHPQLRDALKDRAKIVRTDTGFTAQFDTPTRLRSLRWEFLRRSSADVVVHKLHVTDAKGREVIPVASDFSDAQANDTLEVAPGDTIAVQYVDEVTNSGEKRVLEKTIRSSFNNARVGFFYEELVKKGQQSGLHLREAFRFRAGDNLLVGVYDPDMDVSSKADQMTATVESSSGETKEIRLIEQEKDYHEFHHDRQADEERGRTGVHSGLFLGLLRTIDAEKPLPTGSNAVARAKKAMKVKTGERLTLSYMDRENTNPGVPFQRTAKVQCSTAGKPKMLLFHTARQKVVDTSAKARAQLEKIRRRPGNEQVKVLYRDILVATPMTSAECDGTKPVDVNVATPIPVRVIDPSRACHVASSVILEAVAQSEIDKAKAEEREPEKVRIPLVVGAWIKGFQLRGGFESPKEAQRNGSFNGVLELRLGAVDPEKIVAADQPPQLEVTGSDTVYLRVLDEKGEPMLERTLRLVSNGAIALMDSTWSAERRTAHVGERFYLSVDDADRDASEEPDRIRVTARSLKDGSTNDVELVETMPHSGLFTGTMPSVKYGDRVVFSYRDERTLPGTAARTLSVTGEVFAGSAGSVRLFSKRFRDADAAVLVQFRLAECLFEQAKEHRKLKQQARSQEAIAQGKYILEEALKNHPDSKHVVQGEYLLANLYQELATEQKDAGNKVKATELYTEALARFSSILSAWPNSEFGAKAQFHKALCLEMIGDYARASEEYVKMTYLYPESDLVGDATIRLATYYYKHEKRYDIAGRIYANFQKRFPTHEKAPRTLFMSGSCFIKQAETVQKKYEETSKKTWLCKEAVDLYIAAAKSFSGVAEKYRETAAPEMRAQALYWTGDAYLRCRDYKKSYMALKRTVFEYPETEWARRARGLLLQESQSFDALEQQQ